MYQPVTNLWLVTDYT